MTLYSLVIQSSHFKIRRHFNNNDNNKYEKGTVQGD